MLYPNSFRADGIGDVHFALRVDARDGGQVPDWSMGSNIQVYTVPGSDPPIVVEDRINHLPSQVTWRLALPSRADYRKLLLMRGRAGTLYVVRGLQSHFGVGLTVEGSVFEVLEDTTLLAVSRMARETGGFYEVDVTFQRVADTASYVSEPTMMLNFAGIGSANPLVTPPVLRTPDDVYNVGMSGSVRPGGGRYPGTSAVRLLRTDGAYLNTPHHGLSDFGGCIAIRCRWTSAPAHDADIIRIGDVSTDGIRIWRRSDHRVTARVGSITDLTSGLATTVATNDWIDVILLWGVGLSWCWLDGVPVVAGATLSGNPGVSGNQLIIGSNNLGSRGDVGVDAVMTYTSMSDAHAAQLHRSWAWDWATVTNG